ncbi:MAG TPA: HEXXH motif-containing putative peptide modification protein [Allosphingosinicella sp.]|nr:HEXXH motif-containing putative peptide modification protein [Allosphingosinicella sp.]
MSIGKNRPGELDNKGASFPEDPFFLSDDARFDDLLEQAWRARFTTFMVLQTEVERSFPDLDERYGFGRCAAELIGRRRPRRRALIEDPIFQIWVRIVLRDLNKLLTGARDDPSELALRLSEFPAMLQRIEARFAEARPGQAIPVLRFESDPLLRLAAPPSYDFSTDQAVCRNLERSGHPVSFFAEVVAATLARIEAAWPELHARFQTLVTLIYYLPDADFRSCSASRYTGIILIAAKDASFLDLEESLVHEWGHQLLYRIGEIEPLTQPAAANEESFALPWSGQKRDVYGYFHAFFIYILLLNYFGRLTDRPENEQSRIQSRMAFILRGLSKAAFDLKASRNFTPYGRTLLNRLVDELEGLAARHAPLMKLPDAGDAPVPARVA